MILTFLRSGVGKSDSDDTGDVPQRVHQTRQPDGASPRDESRDLLSSSKSNKVPKSSHKDDANAKRGQHRPKSLSLSRQHSATSSEDELEDTSDETKDPKPQTRPQTNHATSNTVPKKRTRGDGNENVESMTKRASDSHERNNASGKSSSSGSPHSPLTSPVLARYRENRTSPVTHDAQSISPPLSPSDGAFTYQDYRPPSRTHVGEGVYLDSVDIDEPASPKTFSSLEKRFASDMSNRPPARVVELPEVTSEDDDLMNENIMSEHAMDLASYAAAIAVDTANLTNLSVSPVNLPPANVRHIQDHEYLEISPGSEDSCSISPPSPNYYDESDEMELPDPADKSIDYQGTKRQKARPPSNDWSPITDLSPILDVSPSIEAAEQEEMLAQQEKARSERKDEAIQSLYGSTYSSTSEEVFQSPEDISPQPSRLKRYDRYVTPFISVSLNKTHICFYKHIHGCIWK